MNPYHLLNVDQDAPLETITAAYRRQALELHPDHGGAGWDPFLDLQEAFGVLSDPHRRSAFDRSRPPGPEPLAAAQPEAAVIESMFPTPVRCPLSLWDSFATHRPSRDELMERFRELLSLRTPPKAESMQSLTVDVPVSPDQAATGGEVVLQMPARTACPSCASRGCVGRYLCWRCGGIGWVTGDLPVRVSFPAGMSRGWVTRLSLEPLGLRNLHLTLRFRVSDQESL